MPRRTGRAQRASLLYVTCNSRGKGSRDLPGLDIYTQRGMTYIIKEFRVASRAAGKAADPRS